MLRFCEYSDAFGPVGQEAHFHYHGVAIVDTILTLIGALLFSFLFRRAGVRLTGFKLYALCLVGLFGLSIFLHHVFCVCSTVNNYIFPDDPMCSNATTSGIGLDHTEL
jgi:hypothetical protein